ncbi:MAG: 2OG-Fe(II) oxygenase [Bdellovibrionales bacterium]|nr:2OG-Fe(II) oxygenase [Bdellovibrionales bacterium]
MTTSCEHFFTSNFPSPHTIRQDIEEHGFHVYREAIQKNVFAEIQDFWTQFFLSAPPCRNFVRGGLYLGEENFNSFSRNHNWNLYRYFDFLWNEPTHELSQKLAVAIHKKRNQAQGFDESYGLEYSPNCYGIYISVSHYPLDGGFFFPHTDGHSDIPLLHFMLPLTFKNKEYSEGGLVCYDKTGEKIDVDAQMSPGSIVFFDGRQRHAVEPIHQHSPTSAESRLGRIALFAVPTIFQKNSKVPALLRDSKNSFFFGLEGIALKARKTVNRAFNRS